MIVTTTHYLAQLKGMRDTGWQAAAALLTTPGATNIQRKATMASSVTIRTALPGDHEALECIATPVQVDHAREFPTRFRERGSPLPEDYFHTLIQSPDAEILVAENGHGIIVALIVLKIQDAPAIPALQPRRTVFVDIVAVESSQRGQGVGTALMQAAASWGQERDADSVELRVYEFNRAAIAFYEHLGMQTLTRNMWLPLERSEKGNRARGRSVTP